MQIRIRETGQVVYESEFRALFPNTSLPQLLTENIINEFGGDVVFEGPEATGGTVYQYSQRAGVEEIDGRWYTKYVLGPVFTDTPATASTPAKTAAENKLAYQVLKDGEQAIAVRNKRNELLKNSDWTQGKDIPETISNKYLIYRQALRDITTQSGFPNEITWPTQPE